MTKSKKNGRALGSSALSAQGKDTVMSGLPVEERSSSKSPRRKRSAVALLSFGLVLLMTQTGKGQTPNPLTFFKNYFVTGNYFVYGVPLKGTGVNGLATGTITVPENSVPAGGQAIAADLYWSSVVTLSDPNAGLVGAKFKGHDISGIGETLTPAGTSPCWARGRRHRQLSGLENPRPIPCRRAAVFRAGQQRGI